MTKLSILSLGLSSAAIVAVDAAKMLSPAFFKAIHQKQTTTLRRKLDEEADDEEEEEDISFIGSYNILYQNCFSDTRTVTFKLCPDDDAHRQCDQTDCEEGGEYMVDMDEFLDAFLEAQLDAIEYRCEMARENCQEVNDDAVSDCYVAQGSFKNYEEYSKKCEEEDKDGNDEEDEEEEEFDLQNYLKCQALDDDYFIGPLCSDSVNIHLGLFTDEDCMYLADATPEALGYDNIQYTVSSGTSIIEDECASCMEHGMEKDQNGGDDNDDEDKVVEQCEKLYQESYKCETTYMTSDYHTADDSSCDMINSMKTTSVDFQPRATGRSNQTAIIILSAIAVVVGIAAVAMFVKHRNKKKASLNEALM